MLRFADLGGRSILPGHGGIHPLPPLIQQLRGRVALGHERVGAIKLLLRELCLGLLLFEVRPRLVASPLGLADHRLGLSQRGFEIPRIHERDHLARLYHVAFIGEKLSNPAGEFCVDVDLIGFEAAISRRNAGRDPRPRMEPPIAAERGRQQRDKQRGALGPVLFAPLIRYRRQPTPAILRPPAARKTPSVIPRVYCAYRQYFPTTSKASLDLRSA